MPDKRGLGSPQRAFLIELAFWGQGDPIAAVVTYNPETGDEHGTVQIQPVGDLGFDLLMSGQEFLDLADYLTQQGLKK